MAHTTRYFWGDFGLWKQGDTHVTEEQDLPPQVDHGADQERALVTPLGNGKLSMEVLCVGAPHPSSKTQKAWRSQYEAIRAAKRARNLRVDPLVWIEDDSLKRTVDTYSGGTVTTTAAHGRTTGDVVLIRRLGAGLFTLATITVTGASTFTLAAAAGTSVHAIAAADDVYVVEAYWSPMVWTKLGPAKPEPEGDWFARRLSYVFEGSARYTYSRTAASGVGN